MKELSTYLQDIDAFATHFQLLYFTFLSMNVSHSRTLYPPLLRGKVATTHLNPGCVSVSLKGKKHLKERGNKVYFSPGEDVSVLSGRN